MDQSKTCQGIPEGEYALMRPSHSNFHIPKLVKVSEVTPCYAILEDNRGSTLTCTDGFVLDKASRWMPPKTWGYKIDKSKFYQRIEQFIVTHVDLVNGAISGYNYVQVLKFKLWKRFSKGYKQALFAQQRFYKRQTVEQAEQVVFYNYCKQLQLYKKGQVGPYDNYQFNHNAYQLSTKLLRSVEFCNRIRNTFCWYKLGMPWKIK